jgi:hypothetical protein
MNNPRKSIPGDNYYTDSFSSLWNHVAFSFILSLKTLTLLRFLIINVYLPCEIIFTKEWHQESLQINSFDNLGYLIARHTILEVYITTFKSHTSVLKILPSPDPGPIKKHARISGNTNGVSNHRKGRYFKKNLYKINIILQVLIYSDFINKNSIVTTVLKLEI